LASEMKSEIIKVYRFVMPAALVGALIIYLLQDFIISTLFTEDFYPMRELFPWQLAGDLVKINSWILAYILIGRAMVKIYIVTEIIFSVLFFLVSWWLVGIFGLVGVSIAYVVNYTLYWVGMIYVVNREIKTMELGVVT